MPKIITPSKFCCPITHQLLQDPVAAADGRIYGRKAIEEWLSKHDTSPIESDLILANKTLTVTPAVDKVKKEIADFLEKNNICMQQQFFMILNHDVSYPPKYYGKYGKQGKFYYLDSKINYLDTYLDAKNEYGASPLHCAVNSEDFIENIVWLLDRGANVNVQNNNGDAPLHLVRWNIDLLKLLLTRRANVHLQNNQGQTPLYITTSFGDLKGWNFY